MKVTEEHVTRALARALSADGWRIVAVHPPDGQGPFVVPSTPEMRAIERSSFHPDLVAIRKDGTGATVLIAECKDSETALQSDVVKLNAIAESRSALLFALFRCQKFSHGPSDGIDYDYIATLETSKLPIQFALACPGSIDEVVEVDRIASFRCFRHTFAQDSLLGNI